LERAKNVLGQLESHMLKAREVPLGRKRRKASEEQMSLFGEIQ
jgi:hypothetical protein